MEYLLISMILVAILFVVIKQKRKSLKLMYLKNYEFHPLLEAKLRKKYPHLKDEEIEKVFTALKNYFYMCIMANNKIVAMPSQVVGSLWYEFTLMTREYNRFCKFTYGKILDHTATEVMESKTNAGHGIKRAWKLACENEKINYENPLSLPLLFSIDSQLKIEDGYIYTLDCESQDNNTYCASDILSPSQSS